MEQQPQYYNPQYAPHYGNPQQQQYQPQQTNQVMNGVNGTSSHNSYGGGYQSLPEPPRGPMDPRPPMLSSPTSPTSVAPLPMGYQPQLPPQNYGPPPFNPQAPNVPAQNVQSVNDGQYQQQPPHHPTVKSSMVPQAPPSFPPSFQQPLQTVNAPYPNQVQNDHIQNDQVQQQYNQQQQPPPQLQPPLGPRGHLPHHHQQHQQQQQQHQRMPPSMGQRYNQPPQHQVQQQQHQVAPGVQQQQGYGGYGSGPGMHQPQPQQQPQRLDPDAMPSVVQVIEDDRSKFASSDEVIYATCIPASIPPLVTTIGANSIVQDGGCARPQHIRSTVYQVPSTEDVLKTTSIPLGIVVKPFDESEVEGKMSVPISPSEIIRCNRCRAYMSPFMRFIDGGRRFQCALCRHISDVSQTYFAHLDHTGQRLDRYERPELFMGSYEFKATSEFCRNSILNCRRPHLVFAFELTVNSRPIIKKLSQELPAIIRGHLPVDPLRPGSLPPMVGFMTYNSKIQMYDVKNDGHSHVICDINQTFPPITSFLVDPIENMEKIESFLESLPDLASQEELETETILGPVIEAALQTCQVDNNNWFSNEPELNSGETVPPTIRDPQKTVPTGKVYLFHCTLPTYGVDGVTPGRLKARWTTSPEEARKLLGTDKEKQILTPEPSKYYSSLSQKCVVDFGSGVELFLFPPINGSFLDVATLSELVHLTGSGGMYKYYNEPGDRCLTDLKYSLQSSFAFEAVMKIRTSTGIRPFEHFGHYYSRVTSDIEMATINAGNSIAVDLRYDDKLPEDEFAVIQVAILYTAVSGERRVRCHNLGLPVCQTVADVFRGACCDTLMNILLRQSVGTLRQGEHTVQQVKEGLINRSVKILTAYRKHCAQPGSSLGQLILPEALKLLPVYVTGALKCDAIDGGPEMTPDDKAFAQIKTLGSSIRNTQVILYPKLLRIEYEEDEENLRAVHVRCSAIRLQKDSGLCFILENGFYLFIYIPVSGTPANHSKFCKNAFGSDVPQNINPENGLPELLTTESQYLNNLIREITHERRRATKIFVIRQGLDKTEAVFRSFLYEDKKPHPNVMGDSGRYEAPSYVDLLCHLHKEIRAQLN